MKLSNMKGKTIPKPADYNEWLKEHSLSHSVDTMSLFIKQQVSIIRKAKLKQEEEQLEEN